MLKNQRRGPRQWRGDLECLLLAWRVAHTSFLESRVDEVPWLVQHAAMS